MQDRYFREWVMTGVGFSLFVSAITCLSIVGMIVGPTMYNF